MLPVEPPSADRRLADENPDLPSREVGEALFFLVRRMRSGNLDRTRDHLHEHFRLGVVFAPHNPELFVCVDQVSASLHAGLHAFLSGRAALHQAARLKREQHPVLDQVAVIHLHQMLSFVQRRQAIGAVVVAKIRWLADTCAPLAYPAPEHVPCMAFEAPCLRLAAIVDEELGEHFRSRADAKELSVRS
ncbi:hypothetical protein C6Y50_20695 [Stutzerimonas stutzeri]|nr:hypothetical protein C6Y50_20695 [Stutzerimonas stutzeri]